MTGFIYVAANELMTLLTIVIAFPGLLPPKDGPEFFMFAILFLMMSVIWPFYLLVAPFCFIFLYFIGDWHPSDHLKEWPWKQLHAAALKAISALRADGEKR